MPVAENRLQKLYSPNFFSLFIIRGSFEKLAA